MESLNNLRLRMKCVGGSNHQDRLFQDKVRGLRMAIGRRSYQGANIILADGRHFRGLINPDRMTLNYDEKEISIPYTGFCLNSEEDSGKMVDINIKAGDVIHWLDNDTYWLVYLQNLEERAYFRASLRKCKHEVEIGGRRQRAYIRGPLTESIEWIERNGIVSNKLNYNLELYLPNTKENLEDIHRFKILKFQNHNYRIEAIDFISTEGIIAVYAEEYFTNSIKDLREQEIAEEVLKIETPTDSVDGYIEGADQLYPYDKSEYVVYNINEGSWRINGINAKIISSDSQKAMVEVTSGKSGKFELIYSTAAKEIVFPITILSMT